MPPFAGRAMPPFFGFFRKLTVRNSLKIMGRQKGPNIPWEDKPTRSHPQADQEQRVAVRRPPIFIPMGGRHADQVVSLRSFGSGSHLRSIMLRLRFFVEMNF